VQEDVKAAAATEDADLNLSLYKKPFSKLLKGFFVPASSSVAR
jgi:hypothetical protein